MQRRLVEMVAAELLDRDRGEEIREAGASMRVCS